MCTVQYNTTVQYLHESCTCSSRVHVQLCKPRCSQMLSTIADSYESTKVLPYLFLEVPSKQRITSVSISGSTIEATYYFRNNKCTEVLSYLTKVRKYTCTEVLSYFRTEIHVYGSTFVLSYFRTEIDRIQYTYTYDTFTKVRKYCIFVVSIV